MTTTADASKTDGTVLTDRDTVEISYADLKHDPSSLSGAIEKAFGSSEDCLGVIIVRDLPEEYKTLRERLLALAYDFAHLEESVRECYVDPKSRYSFGWSHGKEIMNGRQDSLKGSYYANPVADKPEVSEDLREAYPEYYGGNIWPSDVKGVEGFEEAFKALGQFMFSVGCDLATACQPFVSASLPNSSLSLPELIRSSQIIKARLLHYFPPPADTPLLHDEPVDSWCGFHKDHGLLSGLCSAIYYRAGPNGEPSIVPAPSPSSGLYIRTRGGALQKITIPPDCLAFQTGEALELATAGKLRATPHCVRVGAGPDAALISRETFALFMGPNPDVQLSPSENFGQFSKRIFDEHYDMAVM